LFKVIADKGVKIQPPVKAALKDAADVHRALEGRKTTGATVLIP
jgi:NADPH2:quinone reductase